MLAGVDAGQYRELFLEEMGEQLQRMEGDLLRLEREGESESGVQSLFRAAHTIKGSSGVMGIQEVQRLTHEMEHVLDEVRGGRLKAASELINLFFDCVDRLKAMREELLDDREPSIGIGGLVSQLQQAIRGSGDGPYGHTRQEAQERPASRRVEIALSIAPACEMKLARSLVVLRYVQEYAQIISCSPSPDDRLDDASYEELHIVCVSEKSVSGLKEDLLSLTDVEQVKVSEASGAAAAELPQADDRLVIQDAPGLTAGGKRRASVRVQVEQLELLMNLVGELVIDQTRIHQVKSNLLRKYRSDEDVEALVSVSDHVSKVVSDLQSSMMKARMVPIGQLFNRFPRMVRDLSQSLHKEVELVVAGMETELDRSLIEEVGDPLIHLIRNALDHGIEAPDERIRQGKPAKGRIRIAAAHEDNQVAISVEDDGAGIDADRIRQTAVRKRLLSSEEAVQLTEQEAIRLIFHPGFSTSPAVSEVSGRGVGMDIVKSQIEKLNGLVDIETRTGAGTCFRLRLPLTLAIIVGLLVKLGDRKYIVPLSNIAEIVRVAREEIRTVRGQSVILLRNQVIPIAWMHDLFRLPRKEASRTHISLVIVGSAEKRLALVVDELIGNQEIVIKSLGGYIGKVEGIAGAAMLGNGEVAFILEIPSLIRSF